MDTKSCRYQSKKNKKPETPLKFYSSTKVSWQKTHITILKGEK